MSMLPFTLCARACRLLVTRISGQGSTNCSKLVKSKEPWPSGHPVWQSNRTGNTSTQACRQYESGCAPSRLVRGARDAVGDTSFRASVLVEPGLLPRRRRLAIMQMWARYHGDARRLSRAQVTAAWSGRPLAAGHRPARAPPSGYDRDVWWAWRAWHAGRYAWREPAFERVHLQPRGVSAMNAELVEVYGTGWARAIEAGYDFLPAHCRTCGIPSVLRCRGCGGSFPE